ncbi:MAG: hypothetical protein AB7F35_17770 [Acetobacteraceae bacterium]
MDTNVLLDRAVDRFLAEAEDDLIGLWEIIRETNDPPRDEESAQNDTLRVVRELRAHGLQAGDPPYSDQGHRPWVNQDPDAVIDRIRRESIALGRTPNIPDIVWFGLPETKPG